MIRRGGTLAVAAACIVACSGGDDAPTDAGVDAVPDVFIDVAPPQDAAPDAPIDVVETGPPPLTCNGETVEPNDSEILATQRPDIDDCDGSGSSASGVSSGTGDVDWIRFHGKDKLCIVDPTVKIDATNLRLCAYVMCQDGATTIKGCSNGTPSVSPAKTRGCCANGPGNMTFDIDCTGTSEDVDVFIRVDQPNANACVPYKVDYHF